MPNDLGQSETSARHNLRIEIRPDHQEITLHVAPENIAMLREALDDAERGAKVFLGDGPLLIIRPVGYGGSEAPDA